MRVIRTAANQLIRILFEPACPGCEAILETPLTFVICPSCWQSIVPVQPPFCRICGDELNGSQALTDLCPRCQLRPPVFTTARSAGRYEGALRRLVHAFKYDKRRQLAAPLGSLLRRAGAQLLADADAVVPVPLHFLRSAQRGFNQADDLARELRRPVWRVLRRNQHGPSQTSLPVEERRRNLRRHFGPGIRTRLSTRRRRSLIGTRLVLIDDVMTTGTTLDACARALLDCGAAEVRALTLARAVAGRPLRQTAPPHPSALLRQ